MSDLYDLHKARDNSYSLIIEKKNQMELLEEKAQWFIHDLRKPIEKETIISMLEHFVLQEEYEKCNKLIKTLREWSSEGINKIL